MIPWPEKSFIPSERHGFLYMPIAKVACSSIKDWVIRLVCGDDARGDDNPNQFVQKRLELHKYGEDAAQRILADRSLLRFAFVRNPWDRLVSGFVNKLVQAHYPAHTYLPRRGWRRWLDWFQSLWSGANLSEVGGVDPAQFTFRTFVALLHDEPSQRFDAHWRPQVMFLGNYELDFLGKFESLADDFAELQHKLGLTGRLKQINETRRGAVTRECLADWTLAQLRTLDRFPDYRRFYTDDLVEEVASFYAEDIRSFGYEFGGSVSSLSYKAA